MSVRGEGLDAGGVLLDFGVLKGHVASVMAGLDHKYLNEIEAFATTPPSSENIARHVADRLAPLLSGTCVSVHRVTAWESENASATYYPGTL